MAKITIPVLDLSKFTEGTTRPKNAFAKKLGKAYTPITSTEYLDKRLREIGLKK